MDTQQESAQIHPAWMAHQNKARGIFIFTRSQNETSSNAGWVQASLAGRQYGYQEHTIPGRQTKRQRSK
jgi:hypothetical protein